MQDIDVGRAQQGLGIMYKLDMAGSGDNMLVHALREHIWLSAVSLWQSGWPGLVAWDMFLVVRGLWLLYCDVMARKSFVRGETCPIEAGNV